MHQSFSDKSFNQYSSSGVLPQDVYPHHCKHCHSTAGFHRHSRYRRKCVYLYGVGWIPVLWIQRFRCKSCNKVFSLLPSKLYKWKRADRQVQRDIVLGKYIDPNILEAFSLRTLQRWKAKWNEWAQRFIQQVISWLLFQIPSLSLEVTHDQSLKPIKYLNALWHKATGRLPDLLDVLGLCRFGGRPYHEIPHFLSVVFGIQTLL